LNVSCRTLLHADDGTICSFNQVWTDVTGYRIETFQRIENWAQKAYGEQGTHGQRIRRQIVRLEEPARRRRVDRHHRHGQKRVCSSHPLPVAAIRTDAGWSSSNCHSTSPSGTQRADATAPPGEQLIRTYRRELGPTRGDMDGVATSTYFDQSKFLLE